MKAHTSSVADYFLYVKDIIELDKMHSEIPGAFKKLWEISCQTSWLIKWNFILV